MMEQTVTDSPRSFNRKRGRLTRNPIHFERENSGDLGACSGHLSPFCARLGEFLQEKSSYSFSCIT